MVFGKKCGTEKLHDEWQCSPQSKLVPTSQVSVAIKKKLLELVEKEEGKHHHKTAVKFCEDCIKKVTELNPELQKKCADSPQEIPAESLVPSDPSTSTDIPLSVGESSREQHDVITPPPTKKRKVHDTSALTREEKLQIAFDLGNSESHTSYAVQSSRAKDLNNLLNIDVNDLHMEENELLVSFLSGYTGKKIKSSPYLLCKTVESVLNLSASNLTLPVHFRESVIIYTLTGSKLALQILGSGGAHASYQAVKRWLQNLGTTETQDDLGDVIIGFDNNQVLQRRWKVKLRNDVKCNIVTVVVSFNVCKYGQLQENPMLKPNEWNMKDLDPKELEKIKHIDKDNKIKETHYNFLYPFLEQEIEMVVRQQERKDDVVSDHIDAAVEKEIYDSMYKTCYNCHYKNISKFKHLCPNCKSNVSKSKMRAMGIDEYGNVIEQKSKGKGKSTEYRVTLEKSAGHRHTHKLSYAKQEEEADQYAQCAWYSDYKQGGSQGKDKPDVHVQEPIYVNPCSYEACATVLRNIGKKSAVIKRFHEGRGREWVTVVCDGIPYNLCNRIINSYFICAKCKESLNGKPECSLHQQEAHPNESVDFSPEFDWVLLQPGMGHIEMNMVKGVVELGWDVFWKNMVQCFNFKSEAALKYAKKVSDHHKGWTLCRIARKAITQELILPFVREQLPNKDPDFSAKNFLKFVMKAQDPNYVFMCDFVFEILDAVFLYRAGVRCAIPDFIEAGRAKFAKVWSGRNHPLYRELEMSDSLHLARMPPELREFVTSTASINLTGRENTGEGVDFRLEEVNRLVQQWLPNIPSTDDWKTACCNFDKLIQLREQLFAQMQLTDPKLGGKKSLQNIDDEIIAFRTKIRKSKYLSSPHLPRPHVSIDGYPLDPDLKDFCRNARERRAKYMECYLDHEKTAASEKARPPKFSCFLPIFVTPEERLTFSATENLTVSQIKEKITEGINAVTDQDVKEALESIWTEIKRPTKGALLDFLYEIQDYCDAERDSAIEQLVGDNTIEDSGDELS